MLTVTTKKSLAASLYLYVLQRNVVLRAIQKLNYNKYFFEYKVHRYFFSRTYPWYFIKRGDCVVQVGASSSSIGSSGMHSFYGPSTPFIMSALVGEKGKVVVIEPSDINASAVEKYATDNGLKNITVIRKGVSSTTGLKRFFIDRARPCENIIGDSHKQVGEGYYEEVFFDTLDNIISDHGVPSPDFVSLTINGHEFDALCGMPRVLSSEAVVSLVIQKRGHVYDSLKLLSTANYHVHVGQMPPNPKTPRFLVATAYKPSMSSDHLHWIKDDLLLGD